MGFRKLKRTIVGGFHARKEPKSPEFEELRQRLDNIEGAMSMALNTIKKAEKSWTKVAISAADFCKGLHALYPADDGIRTIFKDTLDETSALQEDICGTESNTSEASLSNAQQSEQIDGIARIVRIIKGYLTEIKTLKREYAKVEDTRLDFAVYQRKVVKMENRDSIDERKMAKFTQLHQSAKSMYFSLLEGILLRMNSTFDKSPTMFRAVYVAYWLSQRRVHTEVSKHFNPAFVYAVNHEKGLFQDIEPPTSIQEDPTS